MTPSPELAALLAAVEDVLEAWYEPHEDLYEFDDGLKLVEGEELLDLADTLLAYHAAHPAPEPVDWSAA
jgi:hypothetical protein